MKEVLSVFIRRLAGGLAAASLMVGSLLLARGEADLIGALLLGYLAAQRSRCFGGWFCG